MPGRIPWMKNTVPMNHSISLILSVCLILSACQQSDDQAHDSAFSHSHGPTAAVGEPGHEETTVGLSVEQMKSIDLHVGGMEQRNLTSSIKANGLLNVPSQNKASVNSLYSGVVEKIHVRPGIAVSAGQAIATLLNPEIITLQEEYLSLAPKITMAQSDLQRQKDLIAGQAGATKNLQGAEATLEGLRIRRAALGRQLTLMGVSTDKLTTENLSSRIVVRSPIRGTVGNVMVNMGAHVGPATMVADVIDNSQLHLDLFVYEKDLPYVKKGQSITFILTNQPGHSYQAEVFSIGTTFENETKAIAIHCVVKGNIKGLIEGMSVTAQLNVSDERVSALPSEAIVNHDGQDYIFLVKKEDPHHAHEGDAHSHAHAADAFFFERIPVKKGPSELGYTGLTLLSEVPADAKFVTKGGFFLLAKMTNAGEAHQH